MNKNKLYVIFLLTYIIYFCISCTSNPAKKQNHNLLTAQIISKAYEISKSSPEKAIKYFDSAFNKIDNPGLNDLFEKYKFKRSFYRIDPKYIDKSLDCSDSLITLLEPVSKTKAYNLTYAQAFLEKGDILVKKKYYEKAYIAYYQGKSNINALGDVQESSFFNFNFYRSLGDILFEKEQFLESAIWQKKAIAELKKTKDAPGKVQTMLGALNNIAFNYEKAKRNDSAMHYINHALNYINSNSASYNKDEFRTARGVILGNLGSLYFTENKLDSAEKNFKESISLSTKNGILNEDAVITSVKLANIYLQKGRLKDVASLLIVITKFERIVTGPETILNIEKLRASYFEQINQPKLAIKFYKSYISKEKIFKNAKKNLFDSDFSKDFEILNKQYEYKLLDKKNKLQSYLLFSVIIFCKLAFFIVYLKTKSYRREQKNNKILSLYNERMNATISELDKSNQEMVKLMRILAHDLKNPINAVYGITALMKDFENRTDEDKKLLNLIQDTCIKLEIVIKDLIAAPITKEESISKNVDFYELIEQSQALLQFKATLKKQKIILKGPQDVFVDMYKEKIWRVINNLVVNAIKFSPEKTAISISWHQNADNVIVSVTDKGIGIPEDMQDDIFTFSGNAQRQGTLGEQSHGMGLFIIRQIIEEHGGSIWIAKTSASGTTFSFSLPLHANILNNSVTS